MGLNMKQQLECIQHWETRLGGVSWRNGCAEMGRQLGRCMSAKAQHTSEEGLMTRRGHALSVPTVRYSETHSSWVRTK